MLKAKRWALEDFLNPSIRDLGPNCLNRRADIAGAQRASLEDARHHPFKHREVRVVYLRSGAGEPLAQFGEGNGRRHRRRALASNLGCATTFPGRTQSSRSSRSIYQGLQYRPNPRMTMNPFRIRSVGGITTRHRQDPGDQSTHGPALAPALRKGWSQSPHQDREGARAQAGDPAREGQGDR